jgi:hypothetical protein
MDFKPTDDDGAVDSTETAGHRPRQQAAEAETSSTNACMHGGADCLGCWQLKDPVQCLCVPGHAQLMCPAPTHHPLPDPFAH